MIESFAIKETMISKLAVISILVVLIICTLYYYFDKRIRVSDDENSAVTEGFGSSVKRMLNVVESFTGADNNKDLIKNGNFGGGKNVGNAINAYNKVGEKGSGLKIVRDGSNGGSGQHYLRIGVGSVGYKLSVNLKAATSYRLSAMWRDANGRDNLYNIVMPLSNQREKILSCNGNVGAKRPGGWTEMVYVFTTPKNLKTGGGGAVDIYLTYKTDIERSVTDISLSSTNPNSSNMPSVDSLRSYVSGDKFSGNSWSLSGGDVGLTWTRKPNIGEGAFLTVGNTLKGGASNKLFSGGSGAGGSEGEDRSFTVFVYAKGVGEGKDGYGNLLNVGGGQGREGQALAVLVPNGSGDMKYILDDDKKGKNFGIVGVNGGEEHVYAVRYDTGADGKVSELSIFVDGASLVSGDSGVTIKNLYYNSDNLLVNAFGLWKAELYGVAIHNAALSKKEITQFGDYMKSNKGRAVVSGAGTGAGAVDSGCNGGNAGSGNDGSNAFLRDMDRNSSLNYWNDNDPDGADGKFDNMSKDRLLEMCTIEADMNPNGAHEACQAYDRRFGSGYDCERNDYCPPAYYKNGKFWVYIPKKSYWARKYGYWGARSYSNDIENARRVYQMNFPECRVPDVLRKEKYIGDMSKCPFVINKDNPCNDYACKGVDWSDPAHFDKEIDNRCRVSVNKYCSNHWDKDESCMCWAPDNFEKKECKEYRKRFSGIDWSLFNINDFAIEDHKDYNKIVKDTRATCWGCSGNEEGDGDRRYKVGRVKA